MARTTGRSRGGSTGRRVAPRSTQDTSGRVVRRGMTQSDPFRKSVKPRPAREGDKSTPSMPPGRYDSGWPRFPSDPYDQNEQESILAEGEEVRPRKVEPAEQGEVQSRGGRLRGARAAGKDPRDAVGSLGFADRPFDKPIASGRPLSKPPLSEKGSRRRR